MWAFIWLFQLSSGFLPPINIRDPWQPTTPDIEGLLKTSCMAPWSASYVNGKSTQPNDFTQQTTFCSNLWEVWKEVFMGKIDEEIFPKNFQRYFDALELTGSPHEIFWSGSDMGELTRLSHYSFKTTSLENTLLGIQNHFVWCSTGINSTNTKEIFNFTFCPTPKAGSPSSYRSFWDGASKRFASVADDEITILLSGSSTRPAFLENSTFARMELPSFSERVTKVQIQIIPNPDVPHEVCGSGSVLQLEEKLNELYPSLSIVCNDKDPVFIALYCSLFPERILCSN